MTDRFSRCLGTLAFIIAALVWGVPDRGLAHDIAATIDNCICEAACYTDEVRDLRCDDREAHFNSDGLPDQSHPIMTGIVASNQQFPATHNHQTTIPLTPKAASSVSDTVPGPLGIAVNGVALFSPDTQGPTDSATGRPVSALAVGELDDCGGHAGRGDDYHYHIAPKCLIEELGAAHIEIEKRPLGWAMDGYPILALGWFDVANDIEAELDGCRGTNDGAQNYFYNVKRTADWDILNCFHGELARGFNRDSWDKRLDAFGAEIVGVPIGFVIDDYQRRTGEGALCHVMTGTLSQETLLTSKGKTVQIQREKGTLFYCNSDCYGQFFEADRDANHRGRVMYYEQRTGTCPAILGLAQLALFAPYEGPQQSTSGRGPGD